MTTVTDTETVIGELSLTLFHPNRIAGTVSVEGQPAVRRPRLYARVSGQYVAETHSAEDGSFEFTGMPQGRYYVLAIDPTLEFEAVTADNIEPVPIDGGD